MDGLIVYKHLRSQNILTPSTSRAAAMRLGLGIAFAGALLVAIPLLSTTALADKRVVLVIGNSAYQKVQRLSNPANDAQAMGKLFKAAGFDVVDIQHDLNIKEMRQAVRDFSLVTRDADVAVVFYAGHGIEHDGNNHLIPIDAELERDIDIEDETISLDRLLKMVEPAKGLRLIILDACRDNPFVASMQRTVRKRSIGSGLAKVELMVSNTLIAFAARAGSTSEDGDGPHSPFTRALLAHLPVPGLDVRLAFGRVRDEVWKDTGYRQEPVIYGSLGGDIISIVPPPRDRLIRLDVSWQPGEQVNAETVKTKFYEVLMSYFNNRYIQRGDRNLIGKIVRNAYGPATLPKALAACIDWKRSSSQQLAITGGYRFTLSRKKGDSCFSSITPELCGGAAVAVCNNNEECPDGQHCVAIDINGVNALELPASWAFVAPQESNR